MQVIQCPSCRNSMDVTEGGREDIVCPTCGSSFRVQQEPTQTVVYENRRLARFELMERVGAGAFGVVWKARDPELDRPVALKIPHAGQVGTDKDKERFLREGRSAARLRHPGIVSVHEIVHHGEFLYLVSDFIEGVTLSDLLTARPLNFREAAGVVADVAEALHYAHSMGVVHRDIKPSNIMLDRRGLRAESGSTAPLGKPMLMDFGLALREDADVTLTVDGQVLGTPAYMSPEQAAGLGHKVDARSDVYSLGVILYQLLTGELPFRGNMRMLMDQVMREEPRAPRRLNDRIPRDLETITLKCLAKERDRRYQTAAELAADLRSWLGGEPIRARPIGNAERLWRWCRRNPVVAGLSAALLALVVTAAITASAAALWFMKVAADREEARAQAVAALDGETKAREAAQVAEGRETAERLRYKDLAERNRQNFYAASINSAYHAWQRGDMQTALELIWSFKDVREPSDFRGFEWYYVWRLCHSELQILRGHDGPVRCVAFSPDGETIATGSNDATVRLWHRRIGQVTVLRHSGQLAALLRPQANWISNVAFSPDGRQLASSSADRTVVIWDTATSKPLARLEHDLPVSCLAFSPDGKTLATGTGMLGTESGNPVNRFVGGQIDGQLRLWDAASGTEKARLPGHKLHVLSVAFSPDGNTLATASADRTVRLWDVATGNELTGLKGHRGIVFSLAFSPDGKTLATGGGEPYLGNGDARLWDVAERKSLLTFQGHAGLVFSVAFAPDGKTLATASFDQTVKLWDLASGQERTAVRGHTDSVLGVAFSHDGRTLATASRDNTVRLWDASGRQDADILKGTKIGGYSTGAYSTAFSADGKLLASGTRIVKLWDVDTGKELHVFDAYQDRDVLVAFAPDGKTLAAAGIAGEVWLWDAETRKQRAVMRGHPGKVWALAFSPDGKTLVSGGVGGAVFLWDVATGRERAKLDVHKGVVRYLAVAPDGQTLAVVCHLTGKERSLVRLWDLVKNEELATLPSSHTHFIEWVAFAPDGKTFATGGWDRIIQLWSTAEQREIMTLAGHMDVIYHGTFSPDGKTLATASWDGTIRLWHVATGRELLSFKGTGGVLWHVAFSPDGRTLATGSGSAEVGELMLLRAAAGN